MAWQMSGEYFENCNCDVICPCEVGAQGPMQARPDQGVCNVYLLFHVNEGRFNDVQLAGQNFVLVASTPGPMGLGNWTVAAYLDASGSPQQQEAMGTIFSGGAGGPPGALTALISTNLGVKAVPITYERDGKRRRGSIPGILEAEVGAVPGSANPDEPVIKHNAHPLFPELTQATGIRSSYTDYDFRWDNTGKCADYASFQWSGG